ncbi:TPA: hypothetical protein LLT22_001542 [Enterobacter asburiae]|nr:hypothetical protein [Enterobacter asburiae]
MTNSSTDVQFVTIDERDYGRCIYKDGTRHYSVLTERRNMHGLRIQRTLNTPAIIAKIDAAFSEAESAGECEVRKTFYANPGWQRQLIATAHREALEMNAERSAKLAKEVMFCDDHRSLFDKCDPYVRGLMIADAHNEALRANELLDTSALVVLNNRDAWKSASATVKKLAVALAQADAQEEDYRFNWLHNRWCLFHSSSRLQQEEIIGVAWEQARQTIEAEEEYNSQRQWKLEAIWKHTHRDYKGESDGVRSILVCRNGTISVPLESLTDKEIEQRSSMWQRNK